MNIKSIMNLSGQMKSLGFSDLIHPLVKRICFKPKRFVLCYQVEKVDNILRCLLSFERDDKALSGYKFSYYDAFFQPSQFYNGTVDGVDISLLAKRMAEINWMKAFDFSEKQTGVDLGEELFEDELKVADVVDSLSILHSSVEGQRVAVSLKQRYWFGIAGQESEGIANMAIKGNADVSQRFYVMDGQPSISVDEAYRYLQNRWLEKEMLARRKQINTLNDDNTEAVGFESGLLKKRRRRTPVGSKARK